MAPEQLAPHHQYWATVIGCMSFTITGMAEGWPSPVLTKIQNLEAPFTLDPAQMSWMVSFMWVGHLISPMPSGLLMDSLGRKGTCQVLSFLPLTSWLLIWHTTSAEVLYLARFIAGLWTGVAYTIVPIYLGEIAEPRLRGSLLVFINLMKIIGNITVYLVGPFVSYSSLAFSSVLVTLIYMALMMSIPESPYFLIMVGRHSQAYATLNWLRGNRGEPFIDEELENIESVLKHQLQKKGSLKDIWFDKGHRKAFIIAQVSSMSKRLTGASVLSAYVSITLPALTFGLFKPDDCVIILGFVSLFSTIVSSCLAVHVNKNTLILYSSSGSGLAMVFIAIWYYLDSSTLINVSNLSDCLFICFIIYNSSFYLGLGTVGASMKGELFAANVKAMCSSIQTIIVAFSSFVLNKFFLIISENLGMHINFFIYAIGCAFIIVFTWKYVPETHGKTLEEIQKLMLTPKRH